MISSERISKRVRQLGRDISEVYANIDTPLVLVANRRDHQPLGKASRGDGHRKVAFHLEEVTNSRIPLLLQHGDIAKLAVVLPGAEPSRVGAILRGDLAGVTVAPEKRVSSWTLTIASPPRS